MIALLSWDIQIDGLVPEGRNSITNELELRLSCTNPSKYLQWSDGQVRYGETNFRVETL